MICAFGSVKIVVEWGFDEVVKRISCRVIRSGTFKRSGDVSRRSVSRDVKGGGSSYADAASVGFRFRSNSAICTLRPGTAGVFAGESPLGRFIDFYA